MIVCISENKIKYTIQEPKRLSGDDVLEILTEEETEVETLEDLTIEKDNQVFHGAFEYYETEDSRIKEQLTEPGGRIVYRHKGKTYKSHPIIKIEKAES